MKITVYQPSSTVDVEIDLQFPAFRKWNHAHYMLISEEESIQVSFKSNEGFEPIEIHRSSWIPPLAVDKDSVAIHAATFYEAYATARAQLDDLTGIEIHQLKQEAYHDDLIQDRQESAEEKAAMYEPKY